MEFTIAKNKLLKNASTIGVEKVKLIDSYKKILASELISDFDVPNFDKSPLDGFCFNSKDTILCNKENPIELEVIDEIPCGYVSSKIIQKNQAIKILTGAKLPKNADCVCRFEDVEYNGKTVKIFKEFKNLENVIKIGEDIKKNSLIGKNGDIIDIGMIGIMASLGIDYVLVYKTPKVGIISTGSELIELGNKLLDGKIYNSNRYIFESAFKDLNIDTKFYGIATDSLEKLIDIYSTALKECDIILSTGGVSVGDYDLVKYAIEKLGLDIIVDRLDIKPGMSCCMANKNEKFVFALSGNPMSALTSFYVVCLPVIKKIMGFCDYENKYFKVILNNSFDKKNTVDRFLRCKIVNIDNKTYSELSTDQGNIMIKSMIGCNGFTWIKKGEEALKGSIHDAFKI